MVDEVAGQLGMSRASLYRLIRLFRADGTVTALMPRTAGRPQGLRLLDAEREAVIRQALEGRLPQDDQGRRLPGWCARWRSDAGKRTYTPQASPHSQIAPNISRKTGCAASI